MTPSDLAQQLSGPVRDAAALARADALAQLPFFQRQAVKVLWGPAMTYGVPIALRIAVELVVDQYRSHVEAVVGTFLSSLEPLLGGSDKPEFRKVGEVLAMLSTPRSEFHTYTQEALDPSTPRPTFDE